MRTLWLLTLSICCMIKPAIALDITPVFPSGIPTETQLFQSMMFPIQQYLEQLRRQSVSQQPTNNCQHYEYKNSENLEAEATIIEVCYQQSIRPKIIKQVVSWTLNGTFIDSFTWIIRGEQLTALSGDELFLAQFAIKNKSEEIEFRTATGIYFHFQPLKDQKKLVIQFPLEDYILTAHTAPYNKAWVQRILARCTQCGPFDITIQALPVVDQGWVYHYYMNLNEYELKPQDALLLITQIYSSPVGAFGYWLLGEWFKAGMPHF